jgi:hypothetical protein
MPTDEELATLHSEWFAHVLEHDTDRLAIEVGFRLAELHDDDEAQQAEPPEQQSLIARADFGIEYATTMRVKSSDAEKFAATNGVFNAWPYWRQLVQSMTAAMGVPPIVVPAFRVPVPDSMLTLPAAGPEDTAGTQASAPAKKTASRSVTRTRDSVRKPPMPPRSTNGKGPG